MSRIRLANRHHHPVDDTHSFAYIFIYGLRCYVVLCVASETISTRKSSINFYSYFSDKKLKPTIVYTFSFIETLKTKQIIMIMMHYFFTF